MLVKKEKASLTAYQKKRDFTKTREPKGKVEPTQKSRFVIQKHDASHLHFDLRLEIDGVLKSWAIPKGPSLDPSNKRLAVQVEDHPLDYGTFEGTIPKKEYGGGTVMLWDEGTFEVLSGNPQEELESGMLKIVFAGQRMRGLWALIRMKQKEDEHAINWLLIKEKDDYVQTEGEDLTERFMNSVKTARSMEEIAKGTTSKSLKKVPMPREFKPELATLVTAAPKGDDWIHEVKLDGYRILAFLKNGEVRLVSRNGLDWTAKFEQVAESVAQLPITEAILDGEVVILDKNGISDFAALQAFAENPQGKLDYFVFDLPYLEGHDLSSKPLLERKNLLSALLEDQDEILYSEHIVGHGPEVFRQARDKGLEGIICKRANSPYRQERTREWLKVKCILRQEFVVGGFTEPTGSRAGFGSLLLGYFDEEQHFIYAGKAGSGFDGKLLDETFRKLEKLVIAESPFEEGMTKLEARGATYVKPALVCDVEFMSWTPDRRLRHPVFKGFREDKKASEVVAEIALPTEAKVTINITHPERVVYPDDGITKLELTEYLVNISKWLLPHIQSRPLALVRCPGGQGAECFFQKNYSDSLPDAIRPIDIGDGGKGIAIDDVNGLIGLAQFGVMEIHPWGSHEDDIELPDRITFDLDPSPEVGWNAVRYGAKRVRDLLAELGLESWIKTSGGKGLHVCVPIKPELGWDVVKEFTHGIALMMESQSPKEFIATMSLAKRKGRIFVDYLRNGRGATSVAAYSPRARAGAAVSMPITWEELENLHAANTFTVKNAFKRLKAQREDPWATFLTDAQDLASVINKLK